MTLLPAAAETPL